MLKLSETNKLDGVEVCQAYEHGGKGNGCRKSFETVCHSKINHASTLHNEAVRRWFRVFGYSS